MDYLQKNLIQLGVVVSAHGVNGQVKVKSFTADPYDLTAYGSLTDREGGHIHVLKIVGEQKGLLIASVQGVTERLAAESLRGTELFVPRSALPQPDEGEFYHEDLIGLSVLLADGSAYGHVHAVHDYGGGPLLEIDREGERALFSFSAATFPDVDIHAGTLVFVPPEVVDQKDV